MFIKDFMIKMQKQAESRQTQNVTEREANREVNQERASGRGRE